MTWKAGSFALNAATGPQAVTGLGFQPTLVLFFWSGSNGADGASVAHAKPGVGAADGSSQFATTAMSRHNQATSDSLTGMRSDACIAVVDAQLTSWDGYASLTSLDADGFTINVDNGGPTIRVGWLATDEPDVAVHLWNSPAATGDHAVTGLGFEPNTLLHVTALLNVGTALPALASGLGIGLGAVDNAGAQWATLIGSADNKPAAEVATWTSVEQCLMATSDGGIGTANPLLRASHVSYDADGFTVNVGGAFASKVATIAMRTKSQARIDTMRNQTTGSKQYTGAGFAPEALLAHTLTGTVPDTFPTSGIDHDTTNCWQWGLGAATDAASEAVMAAVDEDALDPTDTGSLWQSKVLRGFTHTVIPPDDTFASNQVVAELTSLDADGYTLNFTTVTNNQQVEFGALLLAANSVAPLAPTLVSPADGSTVDLATGPTFDWTFNDPDVGDTQSAYALRRKVSGAGTYEYWDASSSTWQSTEVKNTGSATDVTFGAGKWSNGVIYNWSVKTWDASDLEGVYASDATVTGGTPPSVTVDAPSGTVDDTTRPTVEWTFTDPESHAQATWRVKVFSAAQYGAGGFDPDTSPATLDSGAQSGTAASWEPPSDLINGVTYRAYVKAEDSTGQSSGWQYSGFTITLTPPATPTLTATAEPDQARVRLDIAGDVGGPYAPDVTFIVERSVDAGATWTVIRDGDLIEPDGALEATVYDRECPPGVQVLYRASTRTDT